MISVYHHFFFFFFDKTIIFSYNNNKKTKYIYIYIYMHTLEQKIVTNTSLFDTLPHVPVWSYLYKRTQIMKAKSESVPTQIVRSRTKPHPLLFFLWVQVGPHFDEGNLRIHTFQRSAVTLRFSSRTQPSLPPLLNSFSSCLCLIRVSHLRLALLLGSLDFGCLY
jgi:hypothetical protein